jgi:hypothetical protein
LKGERETEREESQKVEETWEGWLEDVENDLRDLKLKRWRQDANNREEWEFLVKGTVLL